MVNPEAARGRMIELLKGIDELQEPDVVIAVLRDAAAVVEAYRRVRTHQVAELPELTRSVDALLRELEIIERTNAWAAESPGDPTPSP